jgi:hypothetical protein
LIFFFLLFCDLLWLEAIKLWLEAIKLWLEAIFFKAKQNPVKYKNFVLINYGNQPYFN